MNNYALIHMFLLVMSSNNHMTHGKEIIDTNETSTSTSSNNNLEYETKTNWKYNDVMGTISADDDDDDDDDSSPSIIIETKNNPANWSNLELMKWLKVPPSHIPSKPPSLSPTGFPSVKTSDHPSRSPSLSIQPSTSPSLAPTFSPSAMPSLSIHPTDHPSLSPSLHPTSIPSESPSYSPSLTPSYSPSNRPSITTMPTTMPSDIPSLAPSFSSKVLNLIPFSLYVSYPSNSDSEEDDNLLSSISLLTYAIEDHLNTVFHFNTDPALQFSKMIVNITDIAIVTDNEDNDDTSKTYRLIITTDAYFRVSTPNKINSMTEMAQILIQNSFTYNGLDFFVTENSSPSFSSSNKGMNITSASFIGFIVPNHANHKLQWTRSQVTGFSFLLIGLVTFVFICITVLIYWRKKSSSSSSSSSCRYNNGNRKSSTSSFDTHESITPSNSPNTKTPNNNDYNNTALPLYHLDHNDLAVCRESSLFEDEETCMSYDNNDNDPANTSSYSINNVTSNATSAPGDEYSLEGYIYSYNSRSSIDSLPSHTYSTSTIASTQQQQHVYDRNFVDENRSFTTASSNNNCIAKHDIVVVPYASESEQYITEGYISPGTSDCESTDYDDDTTDATDNLFASYNSNPYDIRRTNSIISSSTKESVDDSSNNDENVWSRMKYDENHVIL